MSRGDSKDDENGAFCGFFSGEIGSSHGQEPRLVMLLHKLLWPEALERVRSNPSECHWVSDDGLTVLHAAFLDCSHHVPLAIVLSIIEASNNPGIVSQKMRNGCTVLDSILLSWCDLIRSGQIVNSYEYRLRFQVLYRLVSLDPQKIISHKTLEYLFHFVRLWVDGYSCDGDRDSDLDANHCHSDCHRKGNGANPMFAGATRPMNISTSHHRIGNQISFIFAVVDLLLFVHQYHRIRSIETSKSPPAIDRPYSNFVNRLLEIRQTYHVPTLILYLSLEKFGSSPLECCQEYDDSGRTPLIHAILSQPLPFINTHNINRDDRHCHSSESSSVVVTKTLINTILRQGPGTASLSFADGRYPLHLAISRGMCSCSLKEEREKATKVTTCIDRKFTWNTGISLIVFDSPHILREKDVRSGLYPFMQAAATGCDSSIPDLDTIYHLLLLDPLAIPVPVLP